MMRWCASWPGFLWREEAQGMAEPAWVLRSRRARGRRMRPRDAVFFRLQRSSTLVGQLRRSLPGWLPVRFLVPISRLLTLTQADDAARAARGARAILDGVQTSALEN